MLHERISEAEIAAAAWPTTLEGLMLSEPPVADTAAPAGNVPTGPALAAPDVAAGVGGLIVGVYASLIGVFFAFFARSPLALFVICICAFFVAVFFTIPRIFFSLELEKSRRPSLGTFLYRGIETATGHSGGWDALIQMLIVPVFLTLGLLAMGIIGKIYL